MIPLYDDLPAAQSAWIRYLGKEHAARDDYLAVTAQAHRDLLSGPWPDRDTYAHIERQAWMTYYACGRQAWQDYKRELEQPTPIPVERDPYSRPYLDHVDVSGGGVPYSTDPAFTPGNERQD